MKIPNPKEVVAAIRKKARRQLPTDEDETSRKEAAGEQENGKVVRPRRQALEEAPGWKAPRQEPLIHHALTQEAPSIAEPTLDVEHYPAFLGGDGDAVRDMLDHGRSSSERRSNAKPHRDHMEDSNSFERAEGPNKKVAPPVLDQHLSPGLEANDAAIDHKKPKRHGVHRKVSFVPLERELSRNISFGGAIFNGASFNGSSFSGACFDGATFNNGSFDKASFDDATFHGATFNGGSFKGASFHGASFKGVSFEGVSFGQKGLNEVEDRHSLETEDLNHIYSDPEDGEHILNTQPRMRDGDTSSDGAIDGKASKYNGTSRKSGQKDVSTKLDAHSHTDILSYDPEKAVRDGEHKIHPHMQTQVEGTKPQRSFHEFESPALELNYEALKHIATTFFSHGPCKNITTMQRGSYHEIRVLHFEDGWACLARFTRDYEMLCKTESELATIEYVRTHTSIPVPRIYFANFNENHVVGAPFVLMEYIRGQSLCDIWSHCTLEQKLGLIGQIANVLAQLSELKFEGIGCLTPNGSLGPLLNMTDERKPMSDKAFTSTIDFFSAFLEDDLPERSSAAKEHYPAIRDEFRSLMEKKAGNLALNAPYRLIHQDFDIQNILVFQEDESLPYKISGIIDWDWSYTGPLYYLFDYPNFILDQEHAKHLYEVNKALRKHFVASLIDYFPENQAQRKLIKQCFREKSYALNAFVGLFMTRIWEDSLEGKLVKNYLYHIRGGCDEWARLPYSGTLDWEQDSDLTDSDAESSRSETENSDTTTNGTSMESSDKATALDINFEALKHLATYFLPDGHGACVDISEKDEGGTFHEIRTLTFEDGWTCIGRFTRAEEPLYKIESELATAKYVREHTDIPVPEAYFVNYNRNHVVGSAFVLMERLEGVTLDEVWDGLSFEHQVVAVKEIAHVVGQLADLRFDRIGSLTWDGSIGPLINIAREVGENLDSPFTSFDEFVHRALDETRRSRYKGAMAYWPDIKRELQTFLAGESSNPLLRAPFRLIHDDFEFWNILVTRKSKLDPPKISGVIDWDWAWIGPVYYLYEHPPDLTDLQKDPETFATNKSLRKTFVKAIAQRYPKGSDDRGQVRRCFREKSDTLNSFLGYFAGYRAEMDEIEEMFAREYLSEIRNEDPSYNHHPYGIIHGKWVPDSDSDSECDD